jgi:hypothetical protein
VNRTGILCQCLAVLNDESEERLAFLYGQRLNQLDHLRSPGYRMRGPLLRSLIFFRFIAKRVSLRKSWEATAARYYFYAGTDNQLQSLMSTVQALALRDQSVLVDVEDGIDYLPGSEWNGVTFSLSDVMRAGILFMLRAPSLLINLLKNKHPSARRYHFDRFCQPYIYLPYFFRVFEQTRPGTVVIANDHNAANRCLLQVAHRLGLTTVYMQHAAVSTIFPPLRCSIAFLDGRASLAAYVQCESEGWVGLSAPGVPQVFLSGQKKRLVPVSKTRAPCEFVGVAINPMDNKTDVIGLIDYLTQKGNPVRLRWHPRQNQSDVDFYRTKYNAQKLVHISYPKEERVAEFLSVCQLVVAGNSSIHLESVLCGVRSIYYEFSGGIKDYYGFAAAGIIAVANSVEDVGRELDRISLGEALEPATVRDFSESHQTPWFGREGELVAETLALLATGQPVTKIYTPKPPAGPFIDVFGLDPE